MLAACGHTEQADLHAGKTGKKTVLPTAPAHTEADPAWERCVTSFSKTVIAHPPASPLLAIIDSAELQLSHSKNLPSGRKLPYPREWLVT